MESAPDPMAFISGLATGSGSLPASSNSGPGLINPLGANANTDEQMEVLVAQMEQLAPLASLSALQSPATRMQHAVAARSARLDEGSPSVRRLPFTDRQLQDGEAEGAESTGDARSDVGSAGSIAGGDANREAGESDAEAEAADAEAEAEPVWDDGGGRIDPS